MKTKAKAYEATKDKDRENRERDPSRGRHSNKQSNKPPLAYKERDQDMINRT